HVTGNCSKRSHQLLLELRASPRGRDGLGGDADRGPGVGRPERYLTAFVDAGLDADVWQTSYLHVLQGDDPVLEWVKGTALRPVLSLLAGTERDDFVVEYAAVL